MLATKERSAADESNHRQHDEDEEARPVQRAGARGGIFVSQHTVWSITCSCARLLLGIRIRGAGM